MRAKLILAIAFAVGTTVLSLSASQFREPSVKEMLDANAATDTNSVLLQNLSGVNLTLDDVKRQHQGKIIYLEYWASWCGPCRELMPASEAIRDSVMGLKVAFIYLSFDSSHEKWVKASKEENIDHYASNYRITNLETSRFMKKYNVSFIPQAMVLNKSGMVIKRQLYPGGNTLTALLTNLAKE